MLIDVLTPAPGPLAVVSSHGKDKLLPAQPISQLDLGLPGFVFSSFESTEQTFLH
jgi:hypothetical protein